MAGKFLLPVALAFGVHGAAWTQSPVASEALKPDPANANRLCNADASWCATVVEDKDAPGVRIEMGTATQHLPLPALRRELGFDSSAYSLWRTRLPLGNGSLIGTIKEDRTMYSGGGAHAATLTLHRIAAGADAREVLSVPWDSGSMIRACFSEKDFRDRRGACHDEYDYTAEISVTGADAAGFPILQYRAKATSYPGSVSRSADSLAKGRLRKKDLVHVENAECSFTRAFRYDAEAGQYVPDSPLPECGDYNDL